MSNALAVHLLGGGFGESIILCMPNCKIGVVDCYTPTLKNASRENYRETNPTLRFLRTRVKAERLAFLALTHPHEDHGRGISQILDDYCNKIDEVWIFDAFQDIGLERYFTALLSGRRKLPIEKLLGEEPGTFSEELLFIRKRVLEQVDLKNPNRATLRLFSGPRTVTVKDEPVVFHFLGPSEALAQTYKANIIENMEGVVNAEGTEVNDAWKHEAINHNLASPGILCRNGSTRILLGGDVEEIGWQEAVADEHGTQISPPCHFVKISHHGSVTGYTEDLYERLSGKGIPLAALTPFNRHEQPLPRSEGVSYLADRIGQIWTTSIDDAQRSMGIVEALGYEEVLTARPILETWKRAIDSTPELWGAFDPTFVQEMGGDELAKPVHAIPTDWIADLAARPRLAAILHPNLRIAYIPKPARREPLEDEYRLSFLFDDAGNELEDQRHIGGACGRLT